MHIWICAIFSGQAELRVSNDVQKKDEKQSSLSSEQALQTYLSQLASLASSFEDAVYNGFDRLLCWRPI